jgi:hypothetical protein
MRNSRPAKTDGNPAKTILGAGLLVGSLDILTAFADYYAATGKGPEGVLRYVASGVFGMKAFSGNGTMMLWGLFFHFIIAFSFTIFFYWVYPRLKLGSVNPFLTAIVLGIFIWVITVLLVLPMSNVPHATLRVGQAVKAIVILIVMIGLPLSFIMRKRFSGNKNDYQHGTI